MWCIISPKYFRYSLAISIRLSEHQVRWWVPVLGTIQDISLYFFGSPIGGSWQSRSRRYVPVDQNDTLITPPARWNHLGVCKLIMLPDPRIEFVIVSMWGGCSCVRFAQYSSACRPKLYLASVRRQGCRTVCASFVTTQIRGSCNLPATR
jgi:hypothetical protein